MRFSVKSRASLALYRCDTKKAHEGGGRAAPWQAGQPSKTPFNPPGDATGKTPQNRAALPQVPTKGPCAEPGRFIFAEFAAGQPVADAPFNPRLGFPSPLAETELLDFGERFARRAPLLEIVSKQLGVDVIEQWAPESERARQIKTKESDRIERRKRGNARLQVYPCPAQGGFGADFE